MNAEKAHRWVERPSSECLGESRGFLRGFNEDSLKGRRHVARTERRNSS